MAFHSSYWNIRHVFFPVVETRIKPFNILWRISYSVVSQHFYLICVLFFFILHPVLCGLVFPYYRTPATPSSSLLDVVLNIAAFFYGGSFLQHPKSFWIFYFVKRFLPRLFFVFGFFLFLFFTLLTSVCVCVCVCLCVAAVLDFSYFSFQLWRNRIRVSFV